MKSQSNVKVWKDMGIGRCSKLKNVKPHWTDLSYQYSVSFLLPIH